MFAYEAALQQVGCCFDACARLPHLLLRQGLQRTSVAAVPHIDSAPSTPPSRLLVCSHSGAFHMSYQMTGPQGLSPLALAHRQMQRAQLKLPSHCAALRLKTLSPVGTLGACSQVPQSTGVGVGTERNRLSKVKVHEKLPLRDLTLSCAPHLLPAVILFSCAYSASIFMLWISPLMHVDFELAAEASTALACYMWGDTRCC